LDATVLHWVSSNHCTGATSALEHLTCNVAAHLACITPWYMHGYDVVQNRDGVKGRHWFLETDLKDGLAIKLDKTGKSVLSLLRHLNRLTEVCSSLRP
jgi:hypothetical protein